MKFSETIFTKFQNSSTTVYTDVCGSRMKNVERTIKILFTPQKTPFLSKGDPERVEYDAL